MNAKRSLKNASKMSFPRTVTAPNEVSEESRKRHILRARFLAPLGMTGNGPNWTGNESSLAFVATVGDRRTAVVATLLLLLNVAALGSARRHGDNGEPPEKTQFKYAGGTEGLPQGCTGNLELASEALTFKCSYYVVAVPYPSIKLMQYRPDVSKEVRKLKLKWKVTLPGGRGKRNRYFTVKYAEGGATHVVVFKVLPEVMRPYLAAIDLKAGKRVEVKGYEDYE